MAKGFVHTVYRDGKWINQVEEGNELGGAHAATNEAAVTAGRLRAQRDKTEHLIHAKDGTISERNSYGSDPVGAHPRSPTGQHGGQDSVRST
jgi:hypothetical protein